jgi:Domain of unknown function (DUF4134)
MKRKCVVGLRRVRYSSHRQDALFLVAMGITVFLSVDVLAQSGQGSAGIQAAQQEVKGYFGVGTDLMYAIGGIVGLVGAVKVYNKWNSGDQDTGKVAAAWFGSCIFLVVVATVLKAFFNL